MCVQCPAGCPGQGRAGDCGPAPGCGAVRGGAAGRGAGAGPAARAVGRWGGATGGGRCNAGLSVIVIDPAYTSRWGAEHWLRPLREHHPKTTGHHAAAMVTGRRRLGHRARRRATGNQAAPEDAARPAQARTRTTRPLGPHPGDLPPHETPGSHPAPRPAGLTRTRQATRQPSTVRPPARQGYVLLAQ